MGGPHRGGANCFSLREVRHDAIRMEHHFAAVAGHRAHIGSGRLPSTGSPGDRLSPGVGDPHADNFDHLLASVHDLGCRGRQPVEDQAGQHREREAIRQQDCLGEAVLAASREQSQRALLFGGEAESRRKAFIRKWRLKHRAVADSLEEAGDQLFTFARLPPSQWRSARTTNAIERLHEEFKRRIKTQTVLPSADTAAMLFWALLASGQINMRKVD
jgi:hypothetical protein